jgi:PAS domain S-box-containing protein
MMAEARQADGAGPSPEDRDVLDAILRAVGASEAGVDDGVVSAIHEALGRRVPFDALTVSTEEADRSAFRIFARSTARSGFKDIFPNGARVPVEALDVAAREAPGEEPKPVVVENVGERGTALDDLLFDAGVRSYVTVPIRGADDGYAWLTLIHKEAGAPSQEHLALLRDVARALAPAFCRARLVLRARLLATLVDASPDGMLALDVTHVVCEANAAALKLLEKPRSEVVGRPLGEAVGTGAAKAIADVLSARPDLAALALSIAGRAKSLPVDAMVGTVRDTAAEAAFHVHLRDARERRANEEVMTRRLEHLSFLRALGEALGSDLRVRTALERGLDACIARRPIRAIAALRAGGAGTLHLVAARGLDAPLTLRLTVTQRASLEAMDHGGAWSLVLPISHARRSWGVLFVVGRGAEPLADAERGLWDSVAATVSAALHAAEDFEHVVELEAEKRLLVDSLPVIVARVEPALAWSTSFVNGAVERLLGVATVDVLGLPGLDGMLDPADADAAHDARRRASLGERVGWEDRRYRHKDGRVLRLREYVYPVYDVAGTVRSVQLIAYDVTTEFESRQRLVQADRLASLGALAAGIAHEINNPVAFIGLAAAQLPRQRDPERVKELSQEIGEAANRIAHIVGELKLFTRIPDGASATPVDVNRMLETAVTLTSAEIRRRARLDVSLGDLPLAPGRFSGLGQAFVNLLFYGAQAVEAAPPGTSRVVSVTSHSADGTIHVEFKDTGPGIEPEHLPHIFDPFFATDPARPGAGLGLAISYDLVRRAGGDLRVKSVPGKGTTFEVILELDGPPSSDEDGRSAPRLMTYEKPSVAAASPEGVRRRVLIIDDELSLAKALARQLAARYDVDTASTAVDALAQLSVHAYDVVVCDLRMPDQSGPSIHAAVEARSAAQANRFVFTTGGSYGASDDEIHERARATGRPVLEKPFDGPTFEGVVAQVAGVNA